MTLTREHLTVQLYGGEDYRIYDGTRLVATVYNEADLVWLLDRDAAQQTRIEALEAHFRHYHVNNGMGDACEQCGLDLRDAIHTRVKP